MDTLVPIMLSLGAPPLIKKPNEAIWGKPLPFKFHIRWISICGAMLAICLECKDEYTKRLDLQNKEAKFSGAESRITKLTDGLRKKEMKISTFACPTMS